MVITTNSQSITAPFESQCKASSEAEVEEFINQYHTPKDEGGRRAIVRNGYLPERYSYWIRLNPGVRPRVKDRRKEVNREFSLLLASSLNLPKDQKSVEEQENPISSHCPYNSISRFIGSVTLCFSSPKRIVFLSHSYFTFNSPFVFTLLSLNIEGNSSSSCFFHFVILRGCVPYSLNDLTVLLLCPVFGVHYGNLIYPFYSFLERICTEPSIS